MTMDDKDHPALEEGDDAFRRIEAPYYEVTVRLPIELYSEEWFYAVADAAGERAAVSGSVVPSSCCLSCERDAYESLPEERRFLMPMIFVHCSCGNKRCPRSTHHDNPCTGSNETGQPGSWF